MASTVRLADNGSRSLTGAPPPKGAAELLRKFQGKKPEELPGVISFPGRADVGEDGDDISGERAIYNMSQDGGIIYTNNSMGVLRLTDADGESVTVEIGSRFDSGERQLFLNYLLQRVFGGHFIDLVEIGQASMWDVLLVLAFRSRLIAAYAQGVFKKYMRFEHNNTRFRGALNIGDHLRNNLPFRGTLAYTTHEFSYDNPITHLVRHTLRHVHAKYPGLLANAGQAFIEARHAIEQHTPSWDPRGLQRCIRENIRPLRHPYFSAYEPLRTVCLSVLRNEGASLYESDTEHEAEGVIFDGAWLWENYIATLLQPSLGMTHYVFGGPEKLQPFEHGPFLYPDFYHKDVNVPPTPSGGNIIAW